MNAIWQRLLTLAARAGMQWASTRLRAHEDATRAPKRRRRVKVRDKALGKLYQG